MHEEVFEARQLRAVGCCRGEPLNVDVETASERGVPVVYAPGRNAGLVADLTLAFMLCLARSVVSTHQRLVSGELDPGDVKELVSSIGALRGFELGSATVGLLGLGAVGRETARRLAGFGSRVIAHDPRVDDAHFAALGVTRVDLNTLFSESDVLSLHAAVTKETRGIVSEARIAQMKPGAFLINTARHQLVDGDALYAALAEGRLGGAGLDVFKSEPPTKDDPLEAAQRGGDAAPRRRHSRRRAASDRDGRGGPRSHPARRAPPPHRQPGRARLRSDGPALSRLRRRHGQRSSGRLRREARARRRRAPALARPRSGGARALRPRARSRSRVGGAPRRGGRGARERRSSPRARRRRDGTAHRLRVPRRGGRNALPRPEPRYSRARRRRPERARRGSALRQLGPLPALDLRARTRALVRGRAAGGAREDPRRARPPRLGRTPALGRARDRPDDRGRPDALRRGAKDAGRERD